MQNMVITTELIDQLVTKHQELAQQKNLASELLRTAQDRFGHREVEIEREGKKVTVTEKVLWDEVFYLYSIQGDNAEAVKILKGLHPEVFEAFGKQEQLAMDVKKFVLLELSIDVNAMSIADYIRLTLALIEYKK